MNLKHVLIAVLSAGLAGFTLRRWLLTFAALVRGQRPFPGRPTHLTNILLIIPLRNEEKRLPGLLKALEALSLSPSHRVLFVDDGSTDSTAALTRQWCRSRKIASLLEIHGEVGKSEALNRALAHETYGDLVVVFDADERPMPNVLASLALPFSDPEIGGVSGLRAPENPFAGPAASYAALEALVHQWITNRGKDRLDLQPALLGSNCAYSRQMLVEIGGFSPGLYLEDSDITVRMAQYGWKTRFTIDAVSTHAVPADINRYWSQHTRWAAGFQQVSRLQIGALFRNNRLPLGLRLELAAFSSGYLDRLFVLAATGLLLKRKATVPLKGILITHLLTPFFQTLAALQVSRAPEALYRRLFILPFFYLIDIAAAIYGMIRSGQQTSGIWRSTALPNPESDKTEPK